MTEVIAKPVVKNKFWIVEESGEKIGNIQATDDGGCVYVHRDEREVFASIKLLSKSHNIKFVKADKTSKTVETHLVYGYPCSGKPQNELYDVPRKLPIYTKNNKSKSFFCAGYYIVKYNSTWVGEYCPKIIVLNRNEFAGPFKTKEEQKTALKEHNGI